MEERSRTSAQRPSAQQQDRRANGSYNKPKQQPSGLFSNGVLSVVIPALVGAAIASLCFIVAPMLANGGAGGAAAVIDGTVIKESDVTTYIDDMRKTQDLTDDDAWRVYLKESGQTAAGMRQSAIQSLETSIIVDKAAKQLGVSVSDSEVDDTIKSAKESMGGDESYAAYLKAMGMNEDQYRSYVRESLLEEAMSAKIAEQNTPTEEELAEYVSTRYTDTNTVFKKTYSLTLNKETDAELIAALEDGSKSFEDAVKDSGADLEGVSLGWISEASLSDDAAKALSDASKGATSAAVETADGSVSYFMWSDSYTLTTPFTSFDGVPEELKTQLQQSATASMGSNAYNEYMSDVFAHMDVTIYAMPSGLSYDK